VAAVDAIDERHGVVGDVLQIAAGHERASAITHRSTPIKQQHDQLQNILDNMVAGYCATEAPRSL
jgi:hypothetical protein